jgi:Kazal-type serine protease inhibitor domain
MCASNGRTYPTVREVRCLKESNLALEVLHEGACTVQEVEKIIGLDDVCKMAMHTFESNPLCGSDNVTYSNAYTFLCAAKSSPKDKSTSLLAFIFNRVMLQNLLIYSNSLISFDWYYFEGYQK